MQPLTTEQLLSVWEQSSTSSRARKALLLLQAACPDQPLETLVEASVGERDRMLLQLRRWAFGDEVGCRPGCPRCGTELESRFQAGELMAQDSQPGEFEVVEGSWRLRCRVVTSADLLAMEAVTTTESAREVLMSRAITRAEYDGKEMLPQGLPPGLIEKVGSAIEARDPLANIELAFTCPACTLVWQQVFDIVSFFWSEIDAWAIRLLRRVDTLARAYGWSEREILGLSPARAQLYMQLAGG